MSDGYDYEKAKAEYLSLNPMHKPGVKDDSEKDWRPELIAPEMIYALGTVLKHGGEKYADRNWEKGMSWSRVFGALMRHLWAWWGGKAPTSYNHVFGELDDETGHSHLWHASCCLMFLVAHEARETGEDDRWKGTT